ncbi:MAG: OmpA family protein [Janthinobacterium lividum]
MTTLAEIPAQIQQTIEARGLLASQALSDEQPAAMQQALPRVSELVMTSLAELASQPEGRDQVWHLAQGAVAVPVSASSQPGAGLVKEVLVDRFHGTAHTIATAAGVRAATVATLFDVATGAALGILGKLVVERNWSAPQLAQWLRPHQAEPVLTPLAGGAAPLAAVGAGAEQSWFANRSNWLLMAVSVVAVAELGYIIGTRSADADATTTAATGAPGSSGRQYTAIPVASLSPSRTVSATKVPVPVVLKLKNGLRQVIGATSTESKLYQFLVDPSKGIDPTDPTKDWIGFDRIYFDSNKAVLTNESLWQLSNVASILKRFPEAKIKIGGYTDNSGQPLSNLRLSKDRAQAALDALAGLGVPASRLTAVGYGELDNIASNDTEEGRAVNRRVSMQVVQK